MKHLKPVLVAWALSAGAAFAAPQGFALHDTPQPVVNVRYLTEDGGRGNMEDFRDKVMRVQFPTLAGRIGRTCSTNSG